MQQALMPPVVQEERHAHAACVDKHTALAAKLAAAHARLEDGNISVTVTDDLSSLRHQLKAAQDALQAHAQA